MTNHPECVSRAFAPTRDRRRTAATLRGAPTSIVRRRSRVGAPPVVVRASRKSASARKDVRTSERHSRKYLRARPTDRSIDRSIDRFARCPRVGARRATLGRPARCIPPRRARRRRARRRARRHTSITPTIPRASIAPHITSHHTPSPPSCVSSALCCVSTSAAPTIAIPAKISADRARSIAPFQTRTTRTRTPRGRSDDRWRLNTRAHRDRDSRRIVTRDEHARTPQTHARRRTSIARSMRAIDDMAYPSTRELDR